jgi:hypothetical protein
VYSMKVNTRYVTGLFLLYASFVIFGCAERAAGPSVAPEPVDATAAQQPAEQQVIEASEPATVSEPVEPEAPAAPEAIAPFPGVTLIPGGKRVELEAVVCLHAGWLEQIACMPGTREHESLVVVKAKPSHVHAALLLAGFEPGAPGTWALVEDAYTFRKPKGSALAVSFRWTNSDGAEVNDPARTWIRDHLRKHEFPPDPWIFGGSMLEPAWEGEGERYVADDSGSIIGLVTFGDEVIGFSQVLADQAAVRAPEWELDTDRVPEVGTPVVVVIEAAEATSGG